MGPQEHLQTFQASSPAVRVFQYSLGNLAKIWNRNLFFNIWVPHAKISTCWFPEVDSGAFLLKVDISVVSRDWFGLVGWLSQSTGSCEWVGTNSGAHPVVFPFLVMGPNSDWLLLVVLSFWNSIIDFLVRCLLAASPDSMLNDQLLIAGFQSDISRVLSLHYSPANSVLLQVLFGEVWLLGSFEKPLLQCKFLDSFLCLHFLLDFKHDLNTMKLLKHLPLCLN